MTPSIDTWTPEFPGADWCERETYEMYGFDFVGHPNLIKLYLPGEFGVRIEDLVAVTDDGCDVLTSLTKDLIVTD